VDDFSVDPDPESIGNPENHHDDDVDQPRLPLPPVPLESSFDRDLEARTLATSLQREREEADRIWAECKTDRHLASPGSKYSRYDLAVDQQHGDRALEIKLFSWRRPHMRALHCAWISFFLAFVIWVAPSPLLREIQTTLNLSKLSQYCRIEIQSYTG
jgi:hypothetical protein